MKIMRACKQLRKILVMILLIAILESLINIMKKLFLSLMSPPFHLSRVEY